MSNRMLNAVALVSAMCMMGMAQSTTIQFEGDDWRDSAPLAPSLQLSWTWSDDAIGAFEIMGGVATAQAPAVHQRAEGLLDVAWPVSEVTVSNLGSAYEPSMALDLATSTGALTLTTPTPNFATSGGMLTLSDVTVDFVAHRIVADVSGGNGLGAHQDVTVWTFDTLTYDYTGVGGSQFGLRANCALAFEAGCSLVPQAFQMVGLSITSTAFDLFRQGLGLNAAGSAALSSVADYGVMTLSPVPEPASYGLMASGLMVLSLVRVKRRRQCAVQGQATAA